MAYADSSDANVHIVNSEITFADNDAVSNASQAEAQRIIKGQLAKEIDAATLSSWESTPPASPVAPDEIRHIAGKLAAAIRWRGAVAQNVENVNNTYGQKLYDEAMLELQKILTGQVVIPGVVLAGGTQNLNSDLMFYPNDGAGNPKFTMSSIF